MADIDNMQAVIDAARKGVAPHKLEVVGTQATYYVPVGGGFQFIDLEAGLPQPLRKRGSVHVFDHASFSKLLAENATAGNITVYVDRDANKPAIVAVMNGDGATGPGWGDFRILFSFRNTPQWIKWTGISDKFMSQHDFSNFIEDNLADIREPAAADMLEISQFLEVTRTTSFKSVTRPKSGIVQFRNEQTDTVGGSTAESVKIPDVIKLFISPLLGIPPMLIDARFRYRLADGLKLGIKIQRVEEIMAQIMEEIVAEIVLPDGAVMVQGVAPV